MRKTTKKITDAFLSHRRLTLGNTRTDGRAIYLHGNMIAKWSDDDLLITSANWQTNTTKERLNGLPGVSINQKNFKWFLNGKPWCGGWIKV